MLSFEGNNRRTADVRSVGYSELLVLSKKALMSVSGLARFMKRSLILSQVPRVKYVKSIVKGFNKVLFYAKLITHTTPTAFGPIIDRSKILYLLEDLSCISKTHKLLG